MSLSKRRGPDGLVPTENLTTSQRDSAVKLRISESRSSRPEVVPISVITAFKATVSKSVNHTALAYKDANDAWVTYSYWTYYSLVKQAARAFIKLGLKPYHGVGIIGFNSPEWFIVDLAAIFAGGFAVGIYTTNSPDACHQIAEDATCNIIVVENDQQLQKILEVRDRLPELKAIVQYKDQPKEKYPTVYSWTEMMQFGTDDLEKELSRRIRHQAPNKCCTLIYTSGTTGNPKGVMLSHDNIIWTATVLAETVRLTYNNEVLISYLPLSHVAAQLLDLYGPMIVGASVYFAQPDALKGTLGKTLKEVRPTSFFGVPRVWEKIQETMVAIGKKRNPITRKIALLAKGVGLKSNIAIMNGQKPSCWYPIAQALIFRKVHRALGLDRCKLCVSGAAPIMRETVEFFMGFDLLISEAYGMSETTGPHTFSLPWSFTLGSVGQEFPGAKTRIVNLDREGNGEICINGRHVCMGYLNLDDKVKEAFAEDGWLYSGDIGRKDSKGNLFVTGRIKEILITAGGENVAPIPIEDRVKEHLPYVSNCMLIGDKRKFLSILLTLKTELDPDTMEPKDKLAEEARDWCRSDGYEAKTLSEILGRKDACVYKEIQKGIDLVNKKAASRVQVIQKWAILPRDFTTFGGELGPTLKLKRHVVLKTYSDIIEAFYSGDDNG